jgi:glycosyltransferase involved in cell wall biosynthesis
LRGALEGSADPVSGVFRTVRTIVSAVLAAADVFVSTSTLTNMSIPTCEAMVVGVPVVALDVGGTSEVVRHEETGLLVPRKMAMDCGLRSPADAELRPAERRRPRLRPSFMSWDERVALKSRPRPAGRRLLRPGVPRELMSPPPRNRA